MIWKFSPSGEGADPGFARQTRDSGSFGDKGTTKRLEFEEEVLNILQNSGISRVDQYVRNKEGELQSAAPDGLRYIVKEWFSEDECDIRDENEVVKAAGQIAKLHRILRGIQLKEEWNLGSILAEPMEAEFRRHNRELRKARAFISRKRGKSDFELCVIGNFAPFLEQALEAQRGFSSRWRKKEEAPSSSLPRRAEPAPYFNGERKRPL